MKKDKIDHLTLTTKERRDIMKGASKVIKDSERRMRKKGFVMGREITENDRNDHVGCDED